MIFNPIVVGHYIRSRRRYVRNNRDIYLKHQELALRSLLDRSRRYVPFQRERIGASLNYGEIPPTGKREMMEAFTETLNQQILQRLNINANDVKHFVDHHDGTYSPWLEGKIKLSRTTGTTGRPGLFVKTKIESWKNKATDFARNREGKLSLLLPTKNPQRYALLGSDPGNSLLSTGSLVNLVKKRFKRQFAVEGFPLDQSDESLAAALDTYRPYSISGYPHHLLRLAQMRLRGLGPHFEPGRLASGADLLEKRDFNLLRQAFPNAKIVNHYGSVECSPIANSCSQGNLHLNVDLVVCEPVDADDNPVSLGEWSDAALVTSLSQHLQPIIRYRLADSIRIMPESCSCGSAYPILEVRGRRYHIIYLDNDKGEEVAVHSTDIMDPIIDDHALPWSRMKYTKRNEIDYYFFLPTYAQPGVLEDSLAIRARAQAHFDDFKSRLVCSQSLRFNIHIVDDTVMLRDSSKRKRLTATVKSTGQPDMP